MLLYLIRHGQSFVNLKDWDGGNVDAGLTELGHKQARALGAWLPNHLRQIDVFYCSTMQRARETAEAARINYPKVPIHYDDRIREIGNNKLDHSPWPQDNMPEYGDMWGSERPFTPIMRDAENGESLMHFRTRVGSFVEEVAEKHPKQTVVVVCHGGVMEAALNHIFNIGPWQRCEVWSKNTSLTCFEHIEHPNRETWRLHYQNRVEHLAELEQSR
ncbi:MAG: histidine phosphatase family protein [Chloroflexota bacterium]